MPKANQSVSLKGYMFKAPPPSDSIRLSGLQYPSLDYSDRDSFFSVGRVDTTSLRVAWPLFSQFKIPPKQSRNPRRDQKNDTPLLRSCRPLSFL